MPLVIPEGFGLAAYEFGSSAGTAPFITTCGHSLENYTDPAAAADALFDRFAATLVPHISDEMTLERVSLYVGPSPGSGSVESSRDPVTGGRSAGGDAPAAMSAIARKITSDLGRSGRGRMFIPGSVFDVDTDTNGRMSPEQTGVLNTALQDWYDLLVPETPPPEALQPELFHSTEVQPFPVTVITGFSIAPLVGWVRGRIR